MTTLDNAFSDRNAEILGRPGAQNPATLGEIWRAEWQAAGLDTATGVGKPWSDAYQELESAFHQSTGETVFDAAQRRGVKLPGSSYDGRAAAVRQLTGDLDASQLKAIEPYLDVRGRARAKAAEIEKQSLEIGDRTYGLSGSAVGFIAGMARQAVDPINLATLPLGAARGASVVRMLGTEAGVGFATQAAQEPIIQAGRAELGLEAGFGQALTNSLEAGLGAAGFAGLLRGAGYLARRAFAGEAAPIDLSVPGRNEGLDLAAASRPAPDLGDSLTLPALREPIGADPLARDLPIDGYDPALRRSLDELQPDDFDAVAHLVERDATIERMAPIEGDEIAQLHSQGVDIAAGALESGRVLDLPAALETSLGEPFARAVQAKAKAAAKPLSLMQFIARNGGLERSADVDYMAFDKVFVPGGGPLARKTGRSIDGYWRERLIQEGYLPYDGDGYASRDIREELYALLQAEQKGQRHYAASDREMMAARSADQADEVAQLRWERDVEGAAEEIRAAHREHGGEVDAKSLYEAAELLATRQETDPFDALERVFVRQAMNEELPQTVKTNYALKSLEDMLDAVQRGDTPEGGRGAGSGDRGRAEPGQGQADGGSRPDGEGAGAGGGEARPGQGLAFPDDPQAGARLADVQRAMAANGGDLDLYMPGPDGQVVKGSARAAFDRIEAEAKAADELKACLGIKAGGQP